QDAEVEVGVVEDLFDRRILQDIPENAQVRDRQRIDEEVLLASGELEEAYPVVVAVVPRGLGVYPEDGGGAQSLHGIAQGVGGSDVLVFRSDARRAAP